MTFYLVFTYLLLFILIIASQGDKKRVLCLDLGATSHKRSPKISFNKSNSFNILWVLIIIALIVVLGLRGVKTGDYDDYIDLFLEINSGSTIVHPEKSNFLYDWICRICYLAGGSTNSVFLFSAVVTIVFFALGIKYCKANRFLFVALFLLSFQYFDLFNIVRQGMADAIGFYVVCRTIHKKELGEKNGIFPLVLALITVLLHSTGWLFLALFLFISFFKYKIPFAAEIVILIFLSAISTFLATSDTLSNFLTSVFGATWRSGKYNVEMELGAREIGEGIVGIIVWIVFRIKGKNKRDYYLGFLTWLFVVSRFMTTNFRIMYRIADCCAPFFLVSLLVLPQFFKNKSVRIIFLTFVFIFYAIFFFFKIKGYLSYHDYKMIGFDSLFR